MSTLSQRMMQPTSKPPAREAILVLEDGTCFRGISCGALGEAVGEICFNTSLEGYLEVITDPSYAGQIVTMTYPQIGNYGVCLEDAQAAHPALRGLVVRDMCYTPSNWRSTITLPGYLAREGVIAIEGIDTRALVRHVRERGAMRAVISTERLDAESLADRARQAEPIVGVNLAKTVSCTEPRTFSTEDFVASRAFAFSASQRTRHRVVAYDCGIKRSILEGLVRSGCEVTTVPWNMPARDVLAMAPDGVFISNGPGDPDAVVGTYEQVGKLLGEVPVFGICLGHQMMCKAAGARMQKLKFGHHGGNQPVMNMLTQRVEITAQNHGFNLVFSSLGPLDGSCGVSEHSDDLRVWIDRGQAPAVRNPRYGDIRLTHVNLNDGTAEGIAFEGIPAFSVQYHPEAGPGPTDAHYLFEAFCRLMDGQKDYLKIDIARNRLQSWRFSA